MLYKQGRNEINFEYWICPVILLAIMWLISLYYHKSFNSSSGASGSHAWPQNCNTLSGGTAFDFTQPYCWRLTIHCLYYTAGITRGICSIHRVNFHMFILLGRSVRYICLCHYFSSSSTIRWISCLMRRVTQQKTTQMIEPKMIPAKYGVWFTLSV